MTKTRHQKNISPTLFLGCLVFFCTGSALEATPVDLTPPQPGFHWELFAHQKKQTADLILMSDNDDFTNIQYKLDLTKPGILGKANEDEQHQLIIPFPGHTLWNAHPEKRKSADNQFLGILQALGCSIELKPFYSLDGNHIQFNNTSTYLEQTANCKTNVRLSSLRNMIRMRTEDARKQIANQMLGSTGDFLIGFFPEHWDVVEPIIQSDREKQQSFYNQLTAFNLFPLEVLEEQGELVLNELTKLSKGKDFNVMAWLRASKVAVVLKRRLAILSLITHNHRTEDYFVYAVAARFGTAKAWEAFQAINELYRLERAFWRNRGISRPAPTMLSMISPPKDSPSWLEADFAKEVLVYLREDKAWVSSYKVYHYYGALITAARLKNLGFADLIIKKAVQKLGNGYKTSTQGEKSRELPLTKALYAIGAQHGIDLEETFTNKY